MAVIAIYKTTIAGSGLHTVAVYDDGKVVAANSNRIRVAGSTFMFMRDDLNGYAAKDAAFAEAARLGVVALNRATKKLIWEAM